MSNRLLSVAICFLVSSLPLAGQDEVWISDSLSLAGFKLPLLERSGTTQIANGLRDIAVSTDQREVWVLHPDGVAIVEPANDSEVGDIALDDPRGLAFGPGGLAYVVTVSDSVGGQVVVIDIASRRVIDTIAIGADPTSIAIWANGARLYATDRATDSILVIDTTTNEVITSIKVGVEPLDCVVSADGRRLYAATETEVAVIETAGAVVVDTYRLGAGALTRLAASPDGQRLYVAAVAGLLVVETQTGSIVATVPTTFVWDVVVTDDGLFAVVTQWVEGQVAVIDTSSLEVINLRSHPTPFFLALRTTGLFADGFEAGDTGAWSTTVP